MSRHTLNVNRGHSVNKRTIRVVYSSKRSTDLFTATAACTAARSPDDDDDDDDDEEEEEEEEEEEGAVDRMKQRCRDPPSAPRTKELLCLYRSDPPPWNPTADIPRAGAVTSFPPLATRRHTSP